MFEHEKIMQKAVSNKDKSKQVALIALFSASQYWNVQSRGKKPFNPILGETYDLVTPDF